MLGFFETNILPTVGCRELDVSVERMGQALKAADAVGITKDEPSYAAASAFYSRETSYFSRTHYAGSESCNNLVAEANKIILNLNATIADSGGSPVAVPTPELDKATPAADVVSLVKWGLIAAISIAGAVIVTQTIGPILATLKRA